MQSHSGAWRPGLRELRNNFCCCLMWRFLSCCKFRRSAQLKTVEGSPSCNLKPREKKRVLATTCSWHWKCTYLARQTAKRGYVDEVKEIWFVYKMVSCIVFFILTIGDLPMTHLRCKMVSQHPTGSGFQYNNCISFPYNVLHWQLQWSKCLKQLYLSYES